MPRRRRIPSWKAVLLTVVAALLVRACAVEAYRIPTPSMARTLQPGDYVLVSKLHYGARTPVTLGLPLTNVYAAGLRLPQGRLPGLGPVRRGDVVVFNYPPATAPIDRKPHYVKRAVGLPGDTLRLRDGRLHAGDEPVPSVPTMQQRWEAWPRAGGSLAEADVTRLGAAVLGESIDRGRLLFDATPAVASAVRGLEEVAVVDRAGRRPNASSYARALAADGLVVPKRGAAVPLDDATWPVYAAAITRYEGHAARRLADGRFEIDGMVVDTYTFGQDYYFMMGDNRDNSEDSRFWGFVPYDHIVGKALMVYFSWDADANRPRFGRMLHAVE